jgi:DNA-binding PucR family transcriptional regulator
VLLNGLRRVTRVRGSMILACANPTVLRLFEITKLDSTFDIVPSCDEAIARLAERALAPLADDRSGRLTETLAAWLDAQGHHPTVAAELHIHPQTVRYRLARLRERFGGVLDDPDERLALQIALRSRPSISVG